MADELLEYKYLLKQLYSILNKLDTLNEKHDELIISLKGSLLIEDTIPADNELANIKKDTQEIINQIKKNIITEINSRL